MKTREIADFLRGELSGNGDIDITRVAALVTATAGEIAFVEKANSEIVSSASCLIVPAGLHLDNFTYVSVADPKLAFARIAVILHPQRSRAAEIHESAAIATNARIGENVFIGAFVCIGEHSEIGNGAQLRAGAKVGDGVKIGKNSVLHPNVFVEDGCTIGEGVILHAGVIIGADGFGYVRDTNSYIKFPQIGTVVIESDVEIGANSCVDRGALGETRIGEGTKIDNLVQIAHNVQIGKRVIIAAQTGISGSTVIEDDCVIGGQVGIGDHALIKSGSVIGSQAGVLPGKIVRPGTWWGTPVQPLDEYKRQNAHLKGLERLKAEVKEIKENLKNRSD